MALGGGNFQTQNKALPGAYINFISAGRARIDLSERGIVALPVQLNYGPENQIIEIDADNFALMVGETFAYTSDAPEMQIFREAFKHARKAFVYRLSKDAVKASNSMAQAKYGGMRGNDFRLQVKSNVDNPAAFDVDLFLEFRRVFSQKGVASVSELKSNYYVDWKPEAELVVTAGTPLSGGTNGTEPQLAEHQEFLQSLESRDFHTLACPSSVDAVARLYVAFTKRMRDEIGLKFQLVTVADVKADHEGVIYLKGVKGDPAQLCAWLAGAAAGCALSKSLTNLRYNGEVLIPSTEYSQMELADAIKAGELVLHRVGDGWNVLEDINSLTTVTAEKDELFKDNQTIRTLDQIGNDIALLFNQRYLGKIPNDNAGRINLWNDIVKMMHLLQNERAIENFRPEDVSVHEGNSKKSVKVDLAIQTVSAMTRLYLTVIVS